MKTEAPDPRPASRLREAFLSCAEAATPEERDRLLAEIGLHDPELRPAVEALLRHHRADEFLERPAVAVVRPVPMSMAGPVPGSILGPYRLDRELGAGGCGLVFSAEQEQPVRRRVAIKLIKPGMDSRAVIARFELERRTLARMEHPHIARVLDAGTTPTGQPFFVMELVPGVPITRFCDEERLGIAARLQLFLRVAAAVEHAHERGVIHRDLKPSNILVAWQDGEAWPRVIDFGVAKALAAELSNQTTFTVPGFFLGTPAYMSPEQADLQRGAVDRRTDVYGLGALLHELLVGSPPFGHGELTVRGLEAMRKTICTEDARPPSASLKTLSATARDEVAARRDTTPGRLAWELGQEADWVVLRALEKEPDRRYPTVAALAADVRRMLHHEPVEARPPGRIYRLRKLVRRRPLVFASGAAFVVPMLVGLALFLWQSREKDEALELVSIAQRQEHLQKERLARARDDEARLREQTESLELQARRRAYASAISLAQQALAANNLGRAVELLDSQRPSLGQPDLRGWEWRHLWLSCRSEAVARVGQLTNEVHGVAVSPDHQWIAAADPESEVRVWSADHGRPPVHLPRAVRSSPLLFSSAEPRLVYALDNRGRGAAGELLVWDLRERREKDRLRLAGRFSGLVMSRDGLRLLTLTPEGELERWNLATLRREGRTEVGATRRGPGPGSPLLAGDAELERIVYFGEGHRLEMRDARTGQLLWRHEQRTGELWRLSLSPDGALLLGAGGPREGGQIRRWDARDGRELPPLAGHAAWVADVKFLGDGDRFVSVGADQTLRLWSVPGGELLRTWRGHRSEVWSVGVSADGQRIVSGGKNGEVLLWDPRLPARESVPLPLPGILRTWGFAPDQGALVRLDDLGRVWRGPVGSTNATLLFETGPIRLGGVLSGDARLLAAGTPHGSLAVWQVSDGRKLADVGSATEFRVPVAILSGTTNLVTFQPRERTYTRWDLSTGVPMESWAANSSARGFEAQAALELPDARIRFATVGSEGQVNLRWLGGGRDEGFSIALRQAGNLAFSADGKRLAAASGSGRAVVWELDPPRRLGEFGGFLLGTHGAGFSPAGDRLAVASLGREGVKLFDLNSQVELLTLAVEDNRMVNRVRFSPDGQWLAASTPEGQLQLWRAPSWEEIAAAEQSSR